MLTKTNLDKSGTGQIIPSWYIHAISNTVVSFELVLHYFEIALFLISRFFNEFADVSVVIRYSESFQLIQLLFLTNSNVLVEYISLNSGFAQRFPTLILLSTAKFNFTANIDLLSRNCALEGHFLGWY